MFRIKHPFSCSYLAEYSPWCEPGPGLPPPLSLSLSVSQHWVTELGVATGGGPLVNKCPQNKVIKHNTTEKLSLYSSSFMCGLPISRFLLKTPIFLSHYWHLFPREGCGGSGFTHSRLSEAQEAGTLFWCPQLKMRIRGLNHPASSRHFRPSNPATKINKIPCEKNPGVIDDNGK